jgi:trimethylamine:corrinoid methyltransferase-like protein
LQQKRPESVRPFTAQGLSHFIQKHTAMDRIIELNVGGKLFTTAMSTLTMKSAYFKAMLDSGMWKESFDSGKPIFLDRGNRVQFSSLF